MSKGFSQCGGRFLPINSFPQILNGEQEKSAMTYRLPSDCQRASPA
jgi:hypothetical protein